MTEETIFAEALEKKTPSDRTAFLDQACAGDAVLRQRIDSLLKSHDVEDSFLGKPAIQCAAEEVAGQVCAGATQGELPVDDGGVEALEFLAPSDKPDSLGRLGHYEILDVIGRGGMGIVLRAIDEKLQRVVAIKVMAAQLATNAIARKRFNREAQAAAAVTHDHIVTIHAVEDVNGLPYLVMQYVSGMSLQERLDRSGPLELREIVRIGMQTAAGLAAAHAHGLIHRDIKPANILLENGVERVKITDFGLARAVADASLTQSGVVAGTPQYMSPEQARGEAVDQRTDLFSLGSVLYAMCTGRPPFRAESGMAVLKRVCDDIPSAIRETNPEIPDWLVAIVTKLHAKNPADRFQSGPEVAELLKDHLAHLQHPSVVGPVAGNLTAPSGQLTGGEGAVGQSTPCRRRWAIAAAVLLCVVAGLGFAEATSVTHLRATVIRLFTPDGTLVVEVDDPDVKVTIEGDGGIVITGAGLQEVRLKPGSYKLHAAKDGKPVRLDQELVTITRGDKQVVRVRLEAIGLAKATPPLVPRAILEGHGSWVHSLAFSPDGKTLATGSNDQRVRLWDTKTGDLKDTFHAADGLIHALAYSPDGTVLVSASSTVRVWDAATFKLLAEAKHDSYVMAVAFRRGNSMFATASDDKTVKLWKWNGAVLKPVRTLGEHSSGVRAMSFNPQGTVIAAATLDGMLYLWDVESGKLLKSVRLGWQMLLCLAFSPDGTTIAAGGLDKRVELRKADTLEFLGTLRGHKEWVYSLVFLPDGKTLVSAGGHLDSKTHRSDRSGELKLWDTARLKERLSVDGYEKGIVSVALSADGKTLATGDFSNLGRLWDVDALLAAARARETADADSGKIRQDPGHAAKPVLLMHFDETDFYKKDGKTYVRDLSGNGHDGLCNNVAFTPDSKAGGGLLCQGGQLQLAKSLINHQPNYTITAWCRCEKPGPAHANQYLYLTTRPERLNDNERCFNVHFPPERTCHVNAWNADLPEKWIGASAGGSTVPAGWFFVAIALTDGETGKGKLRIVIDDRIRARTSQMVATFDQPQPVDVVGYNMNGVIDELAVFQRALSNEEIEAIRQRGIGGEVAPLAQENPDRRAAEWVLSVGGDIYINGIERLIKVPADLPQGAFQLTTVGLSEKQKVTDTGLAHFKDCKNLTHLYLCGIQVSDTGLAHFKDCKNLTHLWVEFTKFGDAGLAHFKACKNLQELRLNNTQVGDAGLAHFKDCKNLTLLGLEFTKVSDAGLAHFKDCKNLTRLNLRDSQVSDAGLMHIQDCKALNHIVLHNTQVSDAGLETLAGFPSLTWVMAKNTKVTEAGVKKLAAALPGCKIEWDGGVIEPTK